MRSVQVAPGATASISCGRRSPSRPWTGSGRAEAQRGRAGIGAARRQFGQWRPGRPVLADPISRETGKAKSLMLAADHETPFVHSCCYQAGSARQTSESGWRRCNAAAEDLIEMERLAAEAADALAGAAAADVIRWAARTFGQRICITSSMTDAVIIHLTSRLVPGIDVLFLDTGYHFAETAGTRDAVSAVYPVNVINVTPSTTVAEQDSGLGAKLYARNPDLCCYLRKVVPLEQALQPSS